MQACTLLQSVDGVGTKGVGELAWLNRTVLPIADPGLDHVSEAAALEPVDQTIEPSLAVAGFAIEPGVWTCAWIMLGRIVVPVSRTIEHPGEIAKVAPLAAALFDAAFSIVSQSAILAEAAEIPAVVSIWITPTGRILAMGTGASSAQKIAEAAGAFGHEQHQEGLNDG